MQKCNGRICDFRSMKIIMHHQKYEGVIYGLINENYNAPSEYAEGICGLINENHNALVIKNMTRELRAYY